MAVKQRSLCARLTRPYRWRSKNKAVLSISPSALQSIWNRQPSEQGRAYLVNRPLIGVWVPLLVTVYQQSLFNCPVLWGSSGRCTCLWQMSTLLYINPCSVHHWCLITSTKMYYNVWLWVIIQISLQCNEKFNDVEEVSEWVLIFCKDLTLFTQPKCHGIKKRFSHSVKRANFHLISIRFTEHVQEKGGWGSDWLMSTSNLSKAVCRLTMVYNIHRCLPKTITAILQEWFSCTF